MKNALSAERTGRFWLPLAALLLATAIPFTAGAADRMVLGEYFNATW